MDLRHPDAIFRGTDFFMLNGTLTEEELRRQIAGMARQGVMSFIARTYIGLQSDYPGPDFMKKTAVMIDEAKKHGMTVFLQAGYMPEAVLGLPERYALDFLCVYDEDAQPPDEEVLCRHGGKVYTRRCSKTFLNLFDHDAIAFYIHQSYDLWQPFSAEFGKTVRSVWVDEPSYHAEYLPWFPAFSRVFSDTYGFDIRPELYKLYCDEGDFRRIRYCYWTLLQGLLERCYFAMVSAWCRENGLLFSGHLMGEDSLFTQMQRACAAMPYYKYFDIPGMDILNGWMSFSNDPIRYAKGCNFESAIFTTPLQVVSAAHQAGKRQVLCEMYGVTTNGMGFRDFLYYFDCLAVRGINYRSVHGVFYSLHGRSKRQYPPHVNYYQPYWEKYADVTDTCARTSAFLAQGNPSADILVLHPLESAYCLYRGKCGETAGQSEAFRTLDAGYQRLMRQLQSAHVVYELGDLCTVASETARVEMQPEKTESGKQTCYFVVGCMRYQTVVLPALDVLSRAVAEKLRRFLELGGQVIVAAHFPTLLDGTEADVKNEFLSGAEFVESFPALVKRLTQNEATDRILSDRDASTLRVYRTFDHAKNRYYMVMNTDCTTAQNVRLSVYGTVCAERFFPDTGKSEPLPVTPEGMFSSVSFMLYPGGSALIRFSDPAKKENRKDYSEAASLTASAPLRELVTALPAGFHVERKLPNVLLLEFCTYRTEKTDGFEGPYTTLAVNRMLTDADYHGALVQQFRFRSELPFDGLSLALEDAADCEVFFNGVKAQSYDGKSCYCARDFCRIVLPDACRAGENVIEVRRRFTPLSKARSGVTALFERQIGTELENMYLLGDFGVFSPAEPTPHPGVRFSDDFCLGKEVREVPGELTRAGYPFYTGAVSLKKKFVYIKDASCRAADAAVFIELSDFHGSVAEVFVNGISCGDVYRAPYRADVTAALREGENDLEIVLYNTLRPILGPYHRPAGELGECWAKGYDDPDSMWAGAPSDMRTGIDSDEWTNSYLQVRFGISEVKLVERYR